VLELNISGHDFTGLIRHREHFQRFSGSERERLIRQAFAQLGDGGFSLNLTKSLTKNAAKKPAKGTRSSRAVWLSVDEQH
jgi:hypothetical protein